ADRAPEEEAEGRDQPGQRTLAVAEDDTHAQGHGALGGLRRRGLPGAAEVGEERVAGELVLVVLVVALVERVVVDAARRDEDVRTPPGRLHGDRLGELAAAVDAARADELLPLLVPALAADRLAGEVDDGVAAGDALAPASRLRRIAAH